MHYQRQLVFYSDSQSSVHRLKVQLVTSDMLSVSQSALIYDGYKPHALSVDWLNDHLYIAEADKVLYFGLPFAVLAATVNIFSQNCGLEC